MAGTKDPARIVSGTKDPFADLFKRTSKESPKVVLTSTPRETEDLFRKMMKAHSAEKKEAESLKGMFSDIVFSEHERREMIEGDFYDHTTDAMRYGSIPDVRMPSLKGDSITSSAISTSSGPTLKELEKMIASGTTSAAFDAFKRGMATHKADDVPRGRDAIAAGLRAKDAEKKAAAERERAKREPKPEPDRGEEWGSW